MNQKVKAALIIIAVASAIVGTVLGVTYILGVSNQATVDVNEQQIQVSPTLTVNLASITEGDSVILTASTPNQNVDGLPIALYEGGALIPDTTKAITWDAGQSLCVASWTLTPPVGHHVYTAGPP